MDSKKQCKDKFKVGDKVRISLNPSYPDRSPYWVPKMDEFKGKIVTLSKRDSSGNFEIEEDKNIIKFTYNERWFELYNEEHKQKTIRKQNNYYNITIKEQIFVLIVFVLMYIIFMLI